MIEHECLLKTGVSSPRQSGTQERADTTLATESFVASSPSLGWKWLRLHPSA